MANKNKPSFIRSSNRPMLTCVLSDETAEQTIATMRNAIYDGADGFLLDFAKLRKEDFNYNSIKRIVDFAEDKPILTNNYRTPMRQHLSDEEIADMNLLAASAGVSMCDVMGDIFDPSPRERVDPTPLQLSMDPEVIERQKKYVEELHSYDCEVMMSSHTWIPMTVQQTVDHAKALASRGADMVKIAMVTFTEEEMIETIKATIETKQQLEVPFLHVCMGQYGKLHRVFAPFLGSAMVLCVQQYTDRAHMEQPLLRATKQAFDQLDWGMAKDLEIGTIKGFSNL